MPTSRVRQYEAPGQALDQADVVLLLVLGQNLALAQGLELSVSSVSLGGEDDGGALPPIPSCPADLHG